MRTTLLEIDLFVDDDNLAKGAIEILKILRPMWKEEEIKFMNFREGITNKLIGCYLASDTEKEDALVVRVYGQKTELIINRETEIYNMQILHAAGQALPCYARFKNGIVYGFMPGICLDDNVRSPEIYRCVARSMAAMHAVDPVSLVLTSATGDVLSMDKSPALFKKTRKYINLSPDSLPDFDLNERLKHDIPSKEMLQKECDKMEAELSDIGSPVVFCHNDLLLKNIVYNEAKCTASFIDFEYGCFNYAAYDIGNHFAEWAGVDELDFSLYPTKEEQLTWLRYYLEAKAEIDGQAAPVTDKEVERLYVMTNKFSLMAHFFWGVWGLIQAKISTIDFDYFSYAKQKLDEYYRNRDAFLALEIPT